MKKAKPVIRSSKVSLQFANEGKRKSLRRVLTEYKALTQNFVDILWALPVDDVRRRPEKLITDQANTWLSARLIQASAKQASGIVRGTREKIRKTEWVIGQLHADGKFKQERKLQQRLDKRKISCPALKTLQMELDSRFVDIDTNGRVPFDGWVTLTSLGDKLKIVLPFKKTKHFSRLAKAGGILKAGARFSEHGITFMFEMPTPEKVVTGSVLGIDIGKFTLLSCSDGTVSQKNNHGHDLNSILAVMCRKKKGSKAMARCQAHRDNYIHWSVKRLGLTGVKQVNIEKIRGLRSGSRSSRMLSHWVYKSIFDGLKRRCEDEGVQIHEVASAYTSQRCSECGWVRKSNRKGPVFKCKACGFTHDADLNAALNIALGLPAIGKEQRLRRENLKGFYWLPEGHERHIVRATQNEL